MNQAFLISRALAGDLSDGDHFSDSVWHDRARVTAIFVEREMRPCALVIIDVRAQDAAQMALVEDHNVIQKLAANRTDRMLDVSILSR